MYATRDDMISFFGLDEINEAERNIVKGVASTPEDQAELTAKRVAATNAILLAATNEANGYIARRESLPLSSIPDQLKQPVCAIARYRLWKDRASEKVRQDYEDAMRWLKDVSSGAVVLAIDRGITTPNYAAGAVFVV